MRRVNLCILVWLLAGCGHPATVEECEAIIERIALLEITGRNENISRAELKAEIENTKKSLRETMLKRCVGKRITDRAVECVNNAKSSKEIIEECLD